MVTVVNSSIGSVDPGTEDAHYSTLALWEADTDNNLVTGDTQHNGKCRDQEFDLSTSGLELGGATTDATRYRRLTTYQGEGFRDNAPTTLRYGIAGARITLVVAGQGVNIVENFFRVDGLQIVNTSTNGSATTLTGNNNTLVDNCILETYNAGLGRGGLYFPNLGSAATMTARNTVVIARFGSAGFAVSISHQTAATLANVSIVKPSDLTAGGTAIAVLSTNPVIAAKNVAVFGLATLGGGSGITWTTSGTDLTGTTGLTGSLTYADQFENTEDATRDFRLKTGADLIDAGTDLSGSDLPADDDIFGTARPASWDIGCFELAAAGASAAITGTAVDSITEADVVTGGKTIIITLTGDTWETFDDTIRQAIIDGLDSAQAEATGWNAEVRDKQLVAGVVRTSDTVCTITLDAQAAYDVTAQETITVTVPATALVGAAPLTGSPTFTVDIVSATAIPIFWHHYNALHNA
jgi:hypothetical protein